MDISESVSRSFLTAVALLGDPIRAETLVVEAIAGLDAAPVTDKSIRDAVIRRLVVAQIQR